MPSSTCWAMCRTQHVLLGSEQPRKSPLPNITHFLLQLPYRTSNMENERRPPPLFRPFKRPALHGLQVVEQSEQTKTSQAIKPPAPQSSSSVGQQSEDVRYFTVLYAKYQPNKKVCQATAIYNAAVRAV